jgi:hypothetical protein
MKVQRYIEYVTVLFPECIKNVKIPVKMRNEK